MSHRKKKNTSQNKEKSEKTEEEIEYEKLSSFYDKYISSGDLVVKYATLYDLQRIGYVKGKDLKQFFNENFEDIQKNILAITKTNIGKEANKESLQKFYEVNQRYNIMHYLKRIPGDKAKYPKKLLPLTNDDDRNLDLVFSETGFYTLRIKDVKTNKPLIYLVLLIILVLFIVLFPIWPLNVKLGVLYLLLGCMIFLVAFLIVTIIIPIIGVLFGYDINLLPCLDEPKIGWRGGLIESLIEISKREDPCWLIVTRIIILIFLVALCILAYFFPSIPKSCYGTVKNVMIYIFSYGKRKIEEIHYHRNDVSVMDSHYYEDLDNL